MKTGSVSTDWIAASVLAVPPLARETSLKINREENARLIRHLESGGIRTLLYGGNANFYHVGLHEYAEILQFLIDTASGDVWIIPSAGPAFGTMIDQAQVLREFRFPCVMALPSGFPASPAGVETGLRRFVEAAGLPVVLYLKQDGYLPPEAAARLLNEGVACAIKYAIVREDSRNDPYLAQLADQTDRSRIISGIGEQPAIVHLHDFGLGGFTSGCVCVAPRRSMELLQALQRGDLDHAERIRLEFQPLEDLRNRYGPIPVLHEAVALCGISETGPILPLMTNLERGHWPAVEKAARALLAQENASQPEI